MSSDTGQRPVTGVRSTRQRSAIAESLSKSDEFRSAQDLHDQLAGKEALDAKELQDIVYAVGNAHSFDPLRDWFGAIYQVLLGADQGPRFGSFIALYGVNETRKLIADALAGKLLKAD